jgi:hypothetical protein
VPGHCVPQNASWRPRSRSGHFRDLQSQGGICKSLTAFPKLPESADRAIRPLFGGRDLTTTIPPAKSAKAIPLAAFRNAVQTDRNRSGRPRGSKPPYLRKCAQRARAKRPPVRAPVPVRIRVLRTPHPVDIENNARGAQLYPRSCGGILQSAQGAVSSAAARLSTEPSPPVG